MNNRPMTPEQHETAVIWLLAIVDRMIEAHKRYAPDEHIGLCNLRNYALKAVTGHLSMRRREIIYTNFRTLMVKHIRPKVYGSFWFGGTYNPANYRRRSRALNKLRRLIAAGDIDIRQENPP